MTDRVFKHLESRWQTKIQQYLNRQRDSLVARVEGKRGRQAFRAGDGLPTDPTSVSKVYDRQYWADQLQQLTTDLYADIVSTAGIAMTAAYGISFDVDAAYAQNFIAERANRLAGAVSDTTYADVKEQLAQGAASGEGIPKLAGRIRDLFDQTYAKRAETVARTEVVSAYNGSTHQLIHEMPANVVAGMRWIATHDNRVRPTHLALDGQIRGKGMAFELDGVVLSYPGDPGASATLNSQGEIPDPRAEIINCRCTIAPVPPEEMPTDMLDMSQQQGSVEQTIAAETQVVNELGGLPQDGTPSSLMQSLGSDTPVPVDVGNILDRWVQQQGSQGLSAEEKGVVTQAVQDHGVPAPALHRGIIIEDPAPVAMTRFKAGTVMDWGATSFSADAEQAGYYADAAYGDSSWTGVIFHVPNDAIGLDVAERAATKAGYEESEWISAGRFKVDGAPTKDESGFIHVNLKVGS